jgi:hypothetical protein
MGRKNCPHGRQKSQCKECGGSGICSHGRLKHICKDCGGSSICPHERRKYQCKDCGGSGVCLHGKQKSHCRECGGPGLCLHGRRKYQCRECGGSSICLHGGYKVHCKKCVGSGICQHKICRPSCSVCNPEGSYKIYKRSAGKRAHSFNITLGQFKSIVVQPCLYCNESFKPRGIDRWDNKIGYEIENCRPCCGRCNKMKNNLDVSEFIDHCRLIVEQSDDAERQDLIFTLTKRKELC